MTILASMMIADAAQAKIVVGQGIDGISLPGGQAAVQHSLGNPNISNRYGSLTVSNYFRAGLVVSFKQGRVTDVYTDSAKQKTAKGVGPRSSLKSVRKAYPAAKCGAPGSAGLGSRSTVCALKSRYKGQAVTTSFSFRDLSSVYEVDVTFR